MSLVLARTETGVPNSLSARPVYECRRVHEQIKIDGTLAERSWGLAKSIDLILTDSHTSPLFGTKARLLWDDSCLYVSFQCVDDGIYAGKIKKNDALWQEEAVELFLDYEGKGAHYVEIEVNPLNTVFDKFMDGIRKPLPVSQWDSGVRTAVRQENGYVNGDSTIVGWTVELAFPFEALKGKCHVPPKSGDEWRINLYRVKHRPEEQFSAWSPTNSIDFHQPGKFGVLVFSGKEVGEMER